MKNKNVEDIFSSELLSNTCIKQHYLFSFVLIISWEAQFKVTEITDIFLLEEKSQELQRVDTQSYLESWRNQSLQSSFIFPFGSIKLKPHPKFYFCQAITWWI